MPPRSTRRTCARPRTTRSCGCCTCKRCARREAPSGRWRRSSGCWRATAAAPAGFNALGLIYYRLEKHALAESALRRAAELDPSDADAWNNLGLVAHARGRDREAFDAWSKASSLAGASAAPALNKAAVLLDCGDYRRARAELEKAARARPDDPEVLVALGVAHRGLKEHDRARAAYERALELHADYPPALFNLGVLYMDFLPDKKKARAHLILYRKVAPSRDPRQKEAEARLKELR